MQRLNFQESVDALWRGEVVVVATDTVYGVAACLHDATAVARLFEVKNRPRNVALPVMVHSASDASILDVRWSSSAQLLAENFWPGALTLVVEAAESTSSLVGARDTLGLRVPRHEELLAIIAAVGPLAVTSANEHGRAPCVSVEDVMSSQWGAPIAGVYDGGTCDGMVSSVVQLSDEGWRFLRLGAVSGAQIAAVIGPELLLHDH